LAKQTKLEIKTQAASANLTEASEALKRETADLKALKKEKADTTAIEAGKQSVEALKEAERVLTRELKRTQTAEAKGQKAVEELAAQPEEILVRDTELDSIASCLKVLLLALVGVACRKFLECAMSLTGFCEDLVRLPVRIIRRRDEVTYEIELSPRNKKASALLEKAAPRINSQNLRFQGRLIRIALRAPSS
jgi:hypothetical protein